MVKKQLHDGTPSKKRKLDFSFDKISDSAVKGRMSSVMFGSPVQKYKTNSSIQTERLYKLVSMLVKCMLPISIVENQSFRENINYLDPSFSMPTRTTIKNTVLPQLKNSCQIKIKNIIKSIPSISTSMDAWTDAAIRPFNGFVAQGIDYDWNLHTIPIAFDYIDGEFGIFFIHVYVHIYKFFVLLMNLGRHTGKNIKKEYDDVMKFYDLSNKVFKVITDQAANMRNAFANEKEAHDSDELVRMTNELLLNQMKEDTKKKEVILRDELAREIDSWNHISTGETNLISKPPQRRDEILADLMDENIDDITDSTSEHNSSSDTLLDADDDQPPENLENLINEFLLEEEISNYFFILESSK